MRGVNLVISTLIVIVILSITCFSALAVDPYGPKDENPFHRQGSVMMSVSSGGTAPYSFDAVQQIGDNSDVDVCIVSFDANGNAFYEGFTELGGDGAAATVPQTGNSMAYFSTDASIPGCECETLFGGGATSTDYGTAQTPIIDYAGAVANYEMLECGENDIVCKNIEYDDTGGDLVNDCSPGVETVLVSITTTGIGDDCSFDGTYYDCDDDVANIDVLIEAYGLGVDDSLIVEDIGNDANPTSFTECDSFNPTPVPVTADLNDDGTFTIIPEGSSLSYSANPTVTFLDTSETTEIGIDELFCPEIQNYEAGLVAFENVELTISGNTFTTSFPFEVDSSGTYVDYLVTAGGNFFPVMGSMDYQTSNGGTFEYVVPCGDDTTINVQNVDLNNASPISYIVRDSSCQQVIPEPIPPTNTLVPGQAFSDSDVCNLVPGGTVKINSPVQLGISVNEAKTDAFAGYNIYGGLNPDDVFDSVQWMIKPADDLNAEVKLINPNDVEATVTLEVYERGHNIGVYSVDIQPYCTESLEFDDLDKDFITAFKASFYEKGVPSSEIPGNAVLFLEGKNDVSGYAALQSVGESALEAPGTEAKYYEPFFANECQISSMAPFDYQAAQSIYKSSTDEGFNENNGNKVNLTEEWEFHHGVDYEDQQLDSEFTGDFLVEPFSGISLNPSLIESFPFSATALAGCSGQIVYANAPDKYIMSEEGEHLSFIMTTYTKSYDGSTQKDIEIGYKIPVYEESMTPSIQSKPVVEEPKIIDEPEEIPEKESKEEIPEKKYEVEKPEERTYGITGEATNVSPGEPKPLLALIVLAVIICAVLFVKLYRPKPPIDPLKQKK